MWHNMHFRSRTIVTRSEALNVNTHSPTFLRHLAAEDPARELPDAPLASGPAAARDPLPAGLTAVAYAEAEATWK